MKIIIYCFFIITSFQLNAQFGGTQKKEILTSRFLKTNLHILLTGDEHFDKNLKKGFEDFWTITEFEFIKNLDEIDTEDESVSYLCPTQKTITDNYSTQTYNRYGILIGGKENFNFRNVADIILDNFGYEKFVIEAAYRAYDMPKLMQDYIQMRIDGAPISGKTPIKIRYSAGFVYNKKSPKIKQKTLLVDKRQLKSGKYFPYGRKKEFSQADFTSLYNGKVKFVSTKELEEAINERNSNFTYLSTVFSRKKYILVIDCESGSLWYNGYEPSGIGITKKDVKKLSKTVNN